MVFESDALCCVHIVVSFCGCSPRLLILCRQRCLRNLSSKCVPWNDGLLFGGAAGVFHQECSQCEQLCVEWSWSVGRPVSVAAPRGGGGAGSLSPLLPPTDRDRATDRPTDRPTERRKSVVPAPASVFPPARRLVVMFVGAIPLPSLSGPANDSPTDRRKGKDGCRKR